MIEAALFDAAGTLIELREPVGETYARVAAEHGVTLSAARLGDAFARIFAAAPPMVFPRAARAAVRDRERSWWRDVVRGTFRAADGRARFADFDAFFAALYDVYSGDSAWRAIPGARLLLETLRARGLALAIVSNFDSRLPAILDGLGLQGLVDALVLPSEARAAKPDARIFAHACERLGVAPDRAVFVGDDRDRDVAGARAAGLHAIDTASLATLAELPDRLDALGARGA